MSESHWISGVSTHTSLMYSSDSLCRMKRNPKINYERTSQLILDGYCLITVNKHIINQPDKKDAAIKITILWTTHYCGQHTTVDNTLLWTTHYCGQHNTVDNTILWTTQYCGQHTTVDNTLLWTTQYCGQHTTVDNTLLWTTHYCGQHTTVDNTTHGDL